MAEHKFKVGDVIRITDSKVETPDFFYDGDKCTIIKVDDDGSIKADFSLHDNDFVIDDGIWWIGNGNEDGWGPEIELITAAPEVQE